VYPVGKDIEAAETRNPSGLDGGDGVGGIGGIRRLVSLKATRLPRNVRGEGGNEVDATVDFPASTCPEVCDALGGPLSPFKTAS